MRRSLSIPATTAAALVGAVLLRWLLDPLLGHNLSLVTLFGAVAAAVWVGGLYPAMVVAVVGYLACDYLFIDPRGSISVDLPNLVGLVAYLFTSALIIGIGEAMRRAQQRASERGELLRVTLGSIGDAVITTDTEGRVTSMNAAAQALTGWTSHEALGQALDAVFRIVNEQTRQPEESPAARALKHGTVVGLANHTVLMAKDGVERSIDDSAAPIKDEQGRVSGCVLIFRDVSERRRWEKEEADRLLAARQLATIVESSDDAIVRKSLDGIIQSWNAGAERIFGFTAEQAIGRSITLIIPPDRLPEEQRIIARLKAGERVEPFETERLRSDGRPIVVSVTISPIRDETGRVVAASKIVRDVTRQREAKERERVLLAEAAAANAKFRAFFEQGALFAGIMALDGTLLDANRLSWEGCGFTRAQVLGKPFWEGPWWTPSRGLVQRIKAASARAAGGETFRAEMPYYVADGGERAVALTILPIKDETGRALFLAPTGYDITERKIAESERQKFVTLIENSMDFVGICDLEAVPIYINPAGLRMVGLDGMEEARRTPVREFFFPEDQPRMMDEFFATVVETGHAEVDVRFRHFRTGQALWMAYKVLKLTDDEGRAVAFATVSQDVTERRRLQEDLRKLAADLSEVDRRKNEFLATLAHELRNPLAPLSNMLEVLKRDGGTEALPQARAAMERQLGQLVRLVDDLLDLSRITHDRLELRKSRVELGALVNQAVEAVRPLVDAERHTLRVTGHPEPIYLDADPARLAQVFGNLLTNSAKYTDPGGTIEVTTERRGNEALVTVKDNGTGIPRDRLDSIFEMFNQVDRSLERSQGGLGIGLTLVRRLVQMHGGSVEARSGGEGRGSTFVVRLPVLAGMEAAPEPTATVQPQRSRRILVVDDNEDSATSLAMLLQITGNETFTAHEGHAAFEAAERHRPEVVLLDIGLPGLNGYEVCRLIRAQPWGRRMVIIALTGWGQDEDRRKSSAAGFDGHLVKPVNYAALMALLGSSAVVR